MLVLRLSRARHFLAEQFAVQHGEDEHRPARKDIRRGERAARMIDCEHPAAARPSGAGASKRVDNGYG